MNVLMLIIIAAIAAYVAFLIWCFSRWSISTKRSSADVSRALPFVSVVIAARNEEAALPTVLRDLSKQDYAGKWEVIVVDDHSTDGTRDAFNKFENGHHEVPFRLINLADSKLGSGSKKDAITAGIEAANGHWIMTTDADCRLSPTWLSDFIPYLIVDKIQLVAGPVVAAGERPASVIGKIAAMESLGLAVIAAAGIKGGRFMFCNGANLAIRTSAFKSIGGYRCRQDELTGDDTAVMLAIEKKFPGSVEFNDAGIVTTSSDRGLSDFFSRRHRWASKVPGKLTLFTRLMSIVAWTAHAGLLVMLSAVVAGAVHPAPFGIMAAVKTAGEAFLLKAASAKYQQRWDPLLILAAQPFYWLAITLIGLLAVLVPYRWKGRLGR